MIPQEDWNEIFPLPSAAEVKEFCMAASSGDVSQVTGFLNMFGVRIIDERDDIKARAITWAAFGGHTEVVALLLEKGADINAGGTYDKPALSWAIEMDRFDTIRVLLAKGASLDVNDNDGNTPVMIAERRNSTQAQDIIEEHLENLREIEERKQQQAEREAAVAQLAKVRKLKPPRRL